MATCRRVKFLWRMFSVLVIRLRSLRLLRVSGIVMRLRMFLLLITFLKASHSFRNRLLVICKNAYLFATRVRNRRQLNSLQNTWPYGYSMPIAVRYTQDAFSRSGWLWPVDAKGEPLKATSYMAVGFYVAKYVNKKSDMDLAAKGLGAK